MQHVLVLDFGSQYNQLIARRVRELKVYSEIVPYDMDAEKLLQRNPQALILSGGPSSVLHDRAPLPDPAIFNLGLPVLGICYGMQVIARMLGGQVSRTAEREYGHATFWPDNRCRLFTGLSTRLPVWM
ncbi:MAG: gamma-glutamyl-gamma-aminobutyrate hydrolase family protein, partial [candidate division WOR-3 bacterium]